MVVEADKQDAAAAKDMVDEEAGEAAEEEVKQQAGWMMMDFMRCLRMNEPSTSKNAERKEKSAQLVEKVATEKAATSQ
jgi:Asp-tRNA(Asn)/Glu-tRNA(Gln) amidotransferase B subunit